MRASSSCCCTVARRRPAGGARLAPGPSERDQRRLHARGGLHFNCEALKRLHGPSGCHLTSRRPGRPCLAKNSKTDITTCPSLYSYTASRPREEKSSCGSASLPSLSGKASPYLRLGPDRRFQRGLGFPDDPGREADFKTNGAKYISASRRVGVFTSFKRLVSISRGRGWFFFEFEAIRTEPRCSAQVPRRPPAADRDVVRERHVGFQVRLAAPGGMTIRRLVWARCRLCCRTRICLCSLVSEALSARRGDAGLLSFRERSFSENRLLFGPWTPRVPSNWDDRCTTKRVQENWCRTASVQVATCTTSAARSALTDTYKGGRGLPLHPRLNTNGERQHVRSKELGLWRRRLCRVEGTHEWSRDRSGNGVDQEICGNADRGVTRCVLNLGWAFTDPSRPRSRPGRAASGTT